MAFGLLVLIGGSNFVLVRFSNRELDPFWGATLRWGAASLVSFAIVAVRRAHLPRGRALVGVVLYGLLYFGAFYAFAYWGLQRAPAAVAALLFAPVPLLTLLLASAHRLETVTWRGVVGSVIAAAAIVLMVVIDAATFAIPIASLLALLGAAVCAAEGGIVVKLFPPSDPFAANAIGMAAGTAVLLALSLISGERLALPARASTWAAVGALVVLGGVLLFFLVLVVLRRWTASAVSYAFVLFPIVAILLSALLEGTPVTLGQVVGTVVVAFGVWVGALAPARTTGDVEVVRPLVDGDAGLSPVDASG
ncbi:MAG TPA: DMT family transporter [Actinomycetota bacterium]|nr:DMT family transporter [Actinomycetota bacterium]